MFGSSVASFERREDQKKKGYGVLTAICLSVSRGINRLLNVWFKALSTNSSAVLPSVVKVDWRSLAFSPRLVRSDHRKTVVPTKPNQNKSYHVYNGV